MEPFTEIGAGAGGLRTTKWSMILGAKRLEGRAHLGDLVRTYWRPVYDYLRRQRGVSNEDAKDLTQGFFADLLDRPFLEGVAPEKGRFRTFLLACLRNYLGNVGEAAHALKRGGGRTTVPLDFIRAAEEPADASTPEEAFARSWEQAVVREAVRRMREGYEQEGRAVYFAVFDEYDLGSDRTVSYAALAAKLGVSESDVTNYLRHARRRFRELVSDVVRDALDDDVELSDELDFLFRAPP